MAKKDKKDAAVDKYIKDAVDQVTNRRNIKDIRGINAVVQQLMTGFKSVPLTNDKRDSEKIDELTKELDEVLTKETNRYISRDGNTSGKDIAQFFNSLLSQKPKGIQPTDGLMDVMSKKSLTEVMNDQAAQAAVILSDRYKNVNAMYEDVRMVTEQLSELADVIDTMRDTITNNDNLISDISRIVDFGDNTTANDRLSKDLDSVYAMENATGIKEKIKKTIIPETLKYGNYFVFSQPYKDLFAKFKAMDDKINKTSIGGSMSTGRAARPWRRVGEAYVPTQEDKEYVKEFYTEFRNEIDAQFSADMGKASYSQQEFSAAMEGYFEVIDVVNDEEIPLMEDSAISALSNEDMRKSLMHAINKKKKNKTWKPIESFKNSKKYQDGVVGVRNDGSFDLEEAEKAYEAEYQDVTGVFIKLYDPRRVIPVYIMDYCIGYYVLYETGQRVNSAALHAVHSLSRTSALFQNNMQKDFERKLVGMIASRICRSIDKKFLRENENFKELIANAIAYNNFYEKAFRVQFVPSNYMTHFKVNEDPNTHMGVSVLKRSLYYAMLYLTLLNFKIIMITTRSMDTRMFLVHVSEEDKDIAGRVNKVIGEFKQNQISYNDFGSVRGILSKVGKGHDIGIPMSPSGDRSFDVEVMQGQQYDLDTPLTDMLRKGMISNTGCPSAIQNVMEELDFARQLPMIHAKFVSSMVSLQEETEPAVTELYKKLMYQGGYETDEDKLDKLTFKWARPKSINITNITEMISNADQLAEFMIKIFEGENSQNDPRIKDRYFKFLITKILMPGVYDWNRIEEDIKAYRLELRADLKEEQAAAIKADQQQ